MLAAPRSPRSGAACRVDPARCVGSGQGTVAADRLPRPELQLAAGVTDPEVPKLIQSIYGIPAPKTPRNDLVEIFATGIAKSAPTLDGSKPPIQADLNSQILNKDVDAKKFVPAEELRLNLSVPVTDKPNRLGVLAGDLQGFPNGRRLTDDVVDIELRVAMGVLCTLNMGGCTPGDAPSGSLHYTDGAYTSDAFFAAEFPYLRAPLKGSPNDDDALKAARARQP